MIDTPTSRSSDFDAIRYYAENYEVVFQRVLSLAKETPLGSREKRSCRYCLKTRPEVSFRKDAHAVPALLGNTTLLSLDECDICNKRFGTWEDDLGKFTMPERTLAGVSGHQGVPSQSVNTGGRIEVGSDGVIRVSRKSTESFFREVEGQQNVRVELRLQPYRPRAVLKSLIKVAFALTPDKELSKLDACRRWLLCDELERGMSQPVAPYLIETKIPLRFVHPSIVLLRRRQDATVPYMTLAIATGFSAFQIFVPAPDQDEKVYASGNVELVAFPPPNIRALDPAKRPGRVTVHDCESTAKVAGQSWTANFSYSSKQFVK